MQDRNLLVLDLDETLVHASETLLDRQPDVVVLSYFVYFRPGLAEFIASVADRYRLAVWTSSGRTYALEICRSIFPSSVHLEFIWSSEKCTTQWNYDTGQACGAKRLSKLRKRYPLERILMVDDSPEKHTRNYGNLIQVWPFEGDAMDRELDALANYLQLLAGCKNVRTIEKRGWRQSVKPSPSS